MENKRVRKFANLASTSLVSKVSSAQEEVKGSAGDSGKKDGIVGVVHSFGMQQEHALLQMLKYILSPKYAATTRNTVKDIKLDIVANGYKHHLCSTNDLHCIVFDKFPKFPRVFYDCIDLSLEQFKETVLGTFKPHEMILANAALTRDKLDQMTKPETDQTKTDSNGNSFQVNESKQRWYNSNVSDWWENLSRDAYDTHIKNLKALFKSDECSNKVHNRLSAVLPEALIGVDELSDEDADKLKKNDFKLTKELCVFIPKTGDKKWMVTFMVQKSAYHTFSAVPYELQMFTPQGDSNNRVVTFMKKYIFDHDKSPECKAALNKDTMSIFYKAYGMSQLAQELLTPKTLGTNLYGKILDMLKALGKQTNSNDPDYLVTFDAALMTAATNKGTPAMDQFATQSWLKRSAVDANLADRDAVIASGAIDEPLLKITGTQSEEEEE